MRPGHLTELGKWAPQLERLCVEECERLRLSAAQRRLLTPPHARLMPHLREVTFTPQERGETHPYSDLLSILGRR